MDSRERQIYSENNCRSQIMKLNAAYGSKKHDNKRDNGYKSERRAVAEAKQNGRNIDT